MKLCLFLLFGMIGLLPGQDLAGHWTGHLYQNGIGWYDFELQLSARNDSSYTGTSYISCERGSGVMALQASLDSLGFHFQESKIREEHWTTFGWFWCIKAGDLKLAKSRDSLVLSGHWAAPGTCKPGILRVAKAMVKEAEISATSALPARKVETKDVVQIAGDEVLVEIWDNENEDGDIASITLNGTMVLEKHLVAHKKYPFRLALQPGRNVLILYAENLGARPPNTAAITIHYDGKTKTVILNSDKTKSEAIEIMH